MPPSEHPVIRTTAPFESFFWDNPMLCQLEKETESGRLRIQLMSTGERSSIKLELARCAVRTKQARRDHSRCNRREFRPAARCKMTPRRSIWRKYSGLKLGEATEWSSDLHKRTRVHFREVKFWRVQFKENKHAVQHLHGSFLIKGWNKNLSKACD